jgi:predicted NBD/HSP70 family sugar kinase
VGGYLGGSSKLLRAINEAAALGHLFDRGRLTRAELRDLTGLSKPTISEAFKRLTEAGLVSVVGHESGRPGPNAEIYAVNPDAALVISVSIRPSAPSVSAAVCDLAGVVRKRVELSIDFAAVDLVSSVSTLVASLGRPAYVQLAVAGSYDPRVDTIHHVDVPGWDRPGLVGELRERLGAPVGVDNDVNLAAVAERRHGVGQGSDGFALLWIGQGGLGLAIDLGGQLLRGARGGAGEIGYMPIMGVSFQELIGAPAVQSLARSYGIHTDSAAAALSSGNTDLLGALAGRIAVGLAAIVAVLDPPMVVLAGDIGRSGGPALADAVAAELSETVTIAVSAIADDAPLLGAVDAGLSTVRERLLDALRERVSS